MSISLIRHIFAIIDTVFDTNPQLLQFKAVILHPRMKSAQIDAADFDTALRKLRHAEIANTQATAAAAMAVAAATQEAARAATEDVPFWRVAAEPAAGLAAAGIPPKQSRMRRSGKLSASESLLH